MADLKLWENAIAVHDDTGRLLVFSHMDGAATAVGNVALWKSRSAATFRFSSQQTGQWNMPSIPDIATIGGGLPFFTSDGAPLGGIGVSGAPVEDDVACFQAAVDAASLRTSRD